MRRLIPFAMSLVLLGTAAQAGVFDDEEARRQVAEAKRRIEEVNRQLDARIAELDATIKSQGLLDLFTQVEGLKTEIAKLRGQNAVLNNEMESTQKRQRDLYIDLDTRLRKVETAQQQAAAAAAAAAATAAANAAAAAAAAAAAPVPAPAPGTVLPPPAGAVPGATDPVVTPPSQFGQFVPGASPAPAVAAAPGVPPRPGAEVTGEQRAYDAALDQFKSGNYSASLQTFTAFVRTYPRSPLAPSAQYWVGNAHYALKDYRSAIASQRQLINTYPDSQKVPDALLNISSSQIELADTAGAKRTLDDLVQRYPASEAADRARKRLTGSR
ncbi:MAG: tol-pal system protein YbgF [Betaproteobacteria bacterium]|nr:tol-pal system protein YbgF [Betaproteobacteria bacterium]